MDGERSVRDRLIDVGVDLVMAGGAGQVGLREIARRAGVSHGAPRRYFPTHHALLSAIARRGFGDLASRFATAASGTASARGQLQALGLAYVGYALEHRGMFELMFRHDLLETQRHTSEQPRLREATLPLFEGIVELVARCRTEREAAHAPDPPPAVTAAALWANLHGVAQLWAWDSLQLALDASLPGGGSGRDHLDRLVTAALDAHLGPARR